MKKQTTPLSSHTTHGRRPLRRRIATIAALGLCSAALFADGGEGVAETVELARAKLEKWVETQRLISQEKRDWAIGKELLEERLELVQLEIESVRERTAEAREKVQSSESARDELHQENEELKLASSALAELVTGLEARTRALDLRLPPPARDRIQPLVQRIPEDPQDTKSSLSERFQNIVGALDQVNRFHREISVTNELRTLEGGATAEVTVLYLGASKAFYLTSDTTQAGVGTITDDGWTWEPANASAPEIAKAIAILQDGKAAEYVHVPVRIQ